MPGQTTTGSTVPRRQLARQLRDLRNRAKFTVKAAAAALEISEATMWRIETAQTSLRSLDVEGMCRLYGATPELTEALKGLAKETKAKGWWHAYGDVIPEGFDVYIGLEEAASQIAWYESELVPGLLQTEDYARALVAAGLPSAAPEEIDRRVQLRLARQALVRRAAYPLELCLVLNEAILRRPVGGAQVMAVQLDRLAEATQLPNVSIRAVPFSAGMHPGALSGPFEVLRFPVTGDGRDSEPPTVFVQGFTGDLYLDKPNEAQQYARWFAGLWDAALNERLSTGLIREAAQDMRQ
jgi:transcriptional regulator with XRE-family HTH domain